jgi:hypothetical protein
MNLQLSLPDSHISSTIQLNLIYACLGNITDNHQSITFTYSRRDKTILLLTHLSYDDDDSLNCVQEIVDELYVRMNYWGFNVESRVIIGFDGVMNLSPNETVFFIRKNFQFLTAPL